MYKTAQVVAHKHIMVNENLRKLHVLFRVLAIGLGALHVYAAIKSQSMNADGISYLDIGDAYFRADWATAINPVWSPLYSWILGFANFVIRPTIQWEFPVVHLVNFIIYLGALSGFEFMWKRVRTYEASNESYVVPDFWWWTLGYLLFIWISLSLIQLWAVTPDMLMAGLVFLAAGLISKIRAGDDKYRLFLSIGLILGLGYLSKTFMFSVALVFLVLAWLIQKPSWNSLFKTLIAVGVFLLISLPFILLISNVKGKLTIGEAGTITFLRYVNGMPFPHWQGDPDMGIVPTHPSRVIHESPAVYEFGEPVGGTYPISLDPSYWYEGIKPRFDFRFLLAQLLSSSLVYAELFFQQQGILFACILIMYVMGQRRGYSFREILRRWALTISAVIAFGLYGIILVQGRYVGVFILLFWTDILANVRLPGMVNNKSWLNVLSGIAAFGILANIAMFNLDGFRRLNPTLGVGSVQQVAPPAKPFEIAQTLKELGVQPGDKVGVIGYAYDSSWARLAHVRIIAEMLETDAEGFWRGHQGLRQEVLDAFVNAGSKAVVAENVPPYAHLNGWYHIRDTNYYIYVWR